jgi:hypothetical protein
MPGNRVRGESERIGVARIERLTRDVIGGYGLPMEVVIVRHVPPHWQVTVREASHRVLTIELPDSSSVAELRERLKDRLIAET